MDQQFKLAKRSIFEHFQKCAYLMAQEPKITPTKYIMKKLNLTTALLFAAACIFPLASNAASVGQTKAEVMKAHGKPKSELSAGVKEFLIYDFGKVELVDGKVTAINGNTYPNPNPSAANNTPKSSGKIPPTLKVASANLINASGKTVHGASVANAKYTLVYYSAAWCPPCRKFTPKLVNFYNNKKNNSNFELIFVSSDKNQASALKYMKDYKMKWPAVRHDKIGASGLGKYSGRGIPSLVLFDKSGKVISQSYVNGQYRGPTAVMEDLEKLI